MMKARTMKSIIYGIFALSALFFTLAATAQNQDAQIYGGIFYNDATNYRNYGRFVIPRSDAANLDTLTHLVKGSLVFDSLQNRIEYVDTNFAWVALSSGNTLDGAYDQGGAGAGREIDATDGAVKISGTDGLLVTGTFGSGADSEFENPLGIELATMFLNPKKGAFRAGAIDSDQWDDVNIGESSIAIGYNAIAYGGGTVAIGSGTNAIGSESLAMGISTESNGDNSTTFGLNTISESYAETSIGLNNTDYTPTSTTAWSATDRLFVVGNGVDDSNRADALIITKNGNLTMPTTTGAFSPPVLTTTERNALTPTAGMIIFNSTDSKHQGYDGSIWNDLY